MQSEAKNHEIFHSLEFLRKHHQPMLCRISEFLWISVPFILAHNLNQRVYWLSYACPTIVLGVWGSNFVALVSWHSSWRAVRLFWRNYTWGASFIPGSDLYDEILDSEGHLIKGCRIFRSLRESWCIWMWEEHESWGQNVSCVIKSGGLRWFSPPAIDGLV